MSCSFFVRRHSLWYLFVSSTALETSSFHHHVSLCLGGPFVHPHVSSIAFRQTSFMISHLPLTLVASETLFVSNFTFSTNALPIFLSFSFHTLNLGTNLRLHFLIRCIL